MQYVLWQPSASTPIWISRNPSYGDPPNPSVPNPGAKSPICQPRLRRKTKSIGPQVGRRLRGNTESEPGDDHESEEYSLYNIKNPSHRPIEVIAHINGLELTLEVDTSAMLSLISKAASEWLWYRVIAPTLKPSAARLKTYTGETIKVLGELQVNVLINSSKN